MRFSGIVGSTGLRTGWEERSRSPISAADVIEALMTLQRSEMSRDDGSQGI